MEEIAHGEKTL